MSWDWGYRPYVSVAQRRAKAVTQAQKLAKKGQALAPVKIEGRMIARTFWGQAWCKHLESYSDYANRLPRGRAYVRNGSVIDLQIAPGKITAMVMGSELYRGTIAVTPLAAKRWQAIKAECAGKIDSLVGLLQGRLSDAVMRIITDREQGLFPAPSEIKLECSCPDYASLCKHHASVLYGVGARLDAQPELLFVLRGVDHLELIDAAADAPGLATASAGAETDAGALSGAQLSDVFGIDIDVSAATVDTVVPVKPATKVSVTTASSPRRKMKKAAPPKSRSVDAKVKVKPISKTMAKPKPAQKRGKGKL